MLIGVTLMPRFRTLAEAVAEAGQYYPGHGFTFQNQHGNEKMYTFPQIEKETARRAAALQQQGLAKGDRLGMIVIEPEDFVLIFLAALRIGVVPVPMYPPLYLGSVENYWRQTGAILRSSEAQLMVASPKLLDIVEALPTRVETLKDVVPVTSLTEVSTAPHYPDILPGDLAFLQYTSGSTMEPRGVMVTHHSLVSNIEAFMGTGLQLDSAHDRGVTWLPLYHDMGLVGFVLGPVLWGLSIVFIPTLRFAKNASVWLDAVDRHRATVTFAPNFAFALATRRVRRAELERWDLSCLKAVGCGAEPINPRTVREFLRLFSDHCALRPNTLMPAYGLAESTLAVTMNPLGRPIHTRLVESVLFQQHGLAREAVDGVPASEHVSCGHILPGMDVAILDANNMRLPEDVEGKIWVRGPSVAAGYFGRPDAWAEVWRDGWLHTGDIGYLSGGELYVTGRSKDLIILNGRNHHPQTIEWVIAEVNGVREGDAIAFSCPGENGEELVVAVEVRVKDLGHLVADIEDAVLAAISAKPIDVVCLPSGSLPKTSSGKLKRHEIQQRYLLTRLAEERLRPED